MMSPEADNLTGIEGILGLKPEGAPSGAEVTEPEVESKLKYGTKEHGDVLVRILARLKMAKDAVKQRYDAWDQVDEQVRLYANTERGAARPDGTTMTDTTEFPFERGIVVPVSYAVLTVRLSQLMSILLNRSPLWEIDGRGPEDMQASRLIETAIEYDMQQCSALLSLFTQQQDAEKYGLGVIYDVWETEEGWSYSKPAANPELLSEMFGLSARRSREWGAVREFNSWIPIDPYRFWCDPRVPKSTFQAGEFAGHRFNRSYLYLLERTVENGGSYFNIDVLPTKQAEFKDISPKRDSILASSTELSGTTDEKDRGYFTIDHLQIRIVPKDWGLGKGELPEIWWFTVANEAVIVRAHQSSYDHGQYTYSVIESNYDAHALYNPGNIENVSGLQRFMNWLLNSHFENIRKALNDVLVYAPSLIEESDLLNPGPARHVRLSAKGEELLLSGILQPNQFLQQLQVGDVTHPHLEAFRFMYDMVQVMMATNDPQTGQPTKEKKTLGEVNQMMMGSGKRIALSFKLYETMGWQPMVLRAISNRQQFTSLEQFMRITGDAAAADVQATQRLLVRPWDLQGNFDYVPRSATLPPDPSRQAMVWVQLMLGLGKFPQIMAPGPDGKMLDVRKIFNEIARNMGIRNISQFYTQAPPQPPGIAGLIGGGAPGAGGPIKVMPDHEVANGVQRGDIAPLPARLPGIRGMTP
jgi:hypothetical protein